MGNLGDLDAQTAVKDFAQSKREKWAKLLIDHEKFSRDVFFKCGGIFNTKFWEINLSWNAGRDKSLAAAVESIDIAVKDLVITTQLAP